jgi:hypothetical protein
MSRTKGWVLLWALVLATALWQFALLEFVPIGVHGRSLDLLGYVRPWLVRLSVSAPLLALAIVVACLTHPQRPERRAAVLGALAALPIVLPAAFPVEDLRWLLTTLLGGGTWQHALAQSDGLFSPRWVVDATYRMVMLGMVVGAQAVVSAWVGATYWRRGNWATFWRGPGGAVVRGGLSAGAVALALDAALWYGPVGSALRAAVAARGMTTPAPDADLFLRLFILALGQIPGSAVITALLVSRRPAALAGAFAGSGIAVCLMGVSMAYSAWQLQGVAHPAAATAPGLMVMLLFAAAARGATAGIFAGRWRDWVPE